MSIKGSTVATYLRSGDLLVREKLAGTPYAEQFAASES